ncbi:hypothetical protein [Haloechinothrix aidingensis]|uniref:aa3-type cytochrome oxidase subunit CtaJ n=1 Tax=Haloechinothrix aidingensis TaxID=2752311 RepID=UPI0015DF4F56
MSVLETVLYLIVIPGAIYGLISLAALRSKLASTARYRPGQEWEYPPVWWSANPEGVGASAEYGAESRGPARQETARVRGGARGTW